MKMNVIKKEKKRRKKMRNLAHVEKINDIKPIILKDSNIEADNICLYRVLGWWVVGKKGEYEIGDMVIYIEIDSQIPATEDPKNFFHFLANRGFKVKTMKLNKFYSPVMPEAVISQGLLVPTTLLKRKRIEEGEDVTDVFGITKIEDETKEIRVRDNSNQFYKKHKRFFKTRLGKFLMSKKWFRDFIKRTTTTKEKSKRYPSYITKTDETRVQSLYRTFKQIRDKKTVLQVTEKLDGTSSTYGLHKITNKKFDFAVCSRNLRQKNCKQKTWPTNDLNFYWEMAEKYDIKKLLTQLFAKLGAKKFVYIQGETIGPKIQGNKYLLKKRELRLFNLVVDGKKIDSVKAQHIIEEMSDLKWVPILETEYLLPETIEDLLIYATEKSVVYPSTLREGIVLRDAENTVSFKAVSPEFLLKYKI
jgi:hypothetical protein